KRGFARITYGSVHAPMPPMGFSVKTSDDLWKIIAFIRSINPSGANPPEKVVPGRYPRSASRSSNRRVVLADRHGKAQAGRPAAFCRFAGRGYGRGARRTALMPFEVSAIPISSPRRATAAAAPEGNRLKHQSQ